VKNRAGGLMARDRYKKIKPIGDRQRNDSWDLIILDATFLKKNAPNSAENEENKKKENYHRYEKCNSNFIDEESLKKHTGSTLCPMCCLHCKCHSITQLDKNYLFCNSCKTTFSNNWKY
jgi:hypothetical protein